MYIYNYITNAPKRFGASAPPWISEFPEDDAESPKQLGAM
jgi:hypothetical protein